MRKQYTYNPSSMQTFISLLVFCLISLSGLLLPQTTVAYLSPDQVFGGSTTQPPPPTQREGEDVIAIQQQRSAEARREAQKSLHPVDAPQEETYVPEEAPKSRGLFDENAQYEKRVEEMREQAHSAPTIIISGNGDVIDAQGNVLHSGAPLVTSTGPESILAAIAMLCAAICTFVYVRYRNDNMLETA